MKKAYVSHLNNFCKTNNKHFEQMKKISSVPLLHFSHVYLLHEVHWIQSGLWYEAKDAPRMPHSSSLSIPPFPEHVAPSFKRPRRFSGGLVCPMTPCPHIAFQNWSSVHAYLEACRLKVASRSRPMFSFSQCTSEPTNRRKRGIESSGDSPHALNPLTRFCFVGIHDPWIPNIETQGLEEVVLSYRIQMRNRLRQHFFYLR